jgi:hypothetical protein
MNPEHERFAELATRTLENHPELQDEARAELLGRLAHGDPEPGRLSEASARLKSRPPGRGSLLATLAVLALLSISTGLLVRQEIPEQKDSLWAIKNGPTPYAVDDLLQTLVVSLTTEQRDFVFAATGSDVEALAKLERQWQLHPDELGILEEFAHRHLAARETLPPGFSESWRRSDPDNGMWLLLEAMGKHLEWKRAGSVTGDPMHREISSLVKQAARTPRFASYITEIRNKRLSMFPPTSNLAEENRVLFYSIFVHWHKTWSLSLDLQNTGFYDETTRLVATKDGEGLRELIKVWEQLSGRLVNGNSSNYELSAILNLVKGIGRKLQSASKDLGLTNEESEIRRKLALVSTIRSASPSSTDPRHLSFQAQLMFDRSDPNVISDPAEFEPGRRVESAVADRIICLAAAFLVQLFLAGAAIESFRRGRRLNGLADGLQPLFTPADLAWTTGIGLVFPALWYFGITRFTPLGLRDFGLTLFDLPPVLIQTAAALVFSLLLIVQTGRWRITRRAGFLALRPRLPWIGWAMAGIAAAVIPLTGVVRGMTGNETRVLQAIAATGGLPLLWLLWEAAAVIFSPRDQALGGVLLSRRLIAPFAFLAALLLGAGIPLRAVERHWHARDPLTRADRENGGLTLWEARIVDALRSQILEVFPDAAHPSSGTQSAPSGS